MDPDQDQQAKRLHRVANLALCYMFKYQALRKQVDLLEHKAKYAAVVSHIKLMAIIQRILLLQQGPQ